MSDSESWKVVQTCDGEVHYRFLIREIAEKLDVPITEIAHGARIQANLIYFILSSKEAYSARLPRVDILIRILFAINQIAKKKKMKKYTLDDLIKIELAELS